MILFLLKCVILLCDLIMWYSSVVLWKVTRQKTNDTDTFSSFRYFLIYVVIYFDYGYNTVSLNAIRKDNFLDTPCDLCDYHGGPEDSFHFFLQCNMFSTFTRKLLCDVQTVLRKYHLIYLSENLDV